jgi:hypothetical protein
VEVALGGGVARNIDGHVLDALRAKLREIGPGIDLRPTSSPPVLGAALSALDELGAGAEAQARVRRELGRNDG